MNKVHSRVLDEAEWYGVTDAEREELTESLWAEAKNNGSAYVCLLVQPDELLSTCPIPHRHVVWQHRFRDMDKERKQFELDLLEVFGYSRLELHEKQAIARKVFDL
jgi:hypothetical protein